MLGHGISLCFSIPKGVDIPKERLIDGFRFAEFPIKGITYTNSKEEKVVVKKDESRNVIHYEISKNGEVLISEDHPINPASS